MPDTKVLFGVLFCGGVERVAVLQLWLSGSLADKLKFRLQQTQRAGTCDRFGAPLDLEFAIDISIVSFHRVQGEVKPLANLVIRESLSHEVEDF
jgi:hypothetical protein